MTKYTKFLIICGVTLLSICTWYASVIGFGLSSLSDPDIHLEASEKNCPNWQKDAYGNCPKRSHRSRLGVRSFFDGGGK
jgi:hypothetical protein